MAIDNTPPRLKLIATIAAITIVTLVSLDVVLKSYYAQMTDDAAREKVAPTKDLDEQKKAEQAALGGAALPVDQAIAQLAKGGRAEIIVPKPSDDLGPMTGWSKMPKPAPHPMPAAPPPAPDLLLPTMGDGGVDMHGDAGATTLAAGDAGVHAKDGGAPGKDAKDAGAPGKDLKDAGAPKKAAKDGGAPGAPGAP